MAAELDDFFARILELSREAEGGAKKPVPTREDIGSLKQGLKECLEDAEAGDRLVRLLNETPRYEYGLDEPLDPVILRRCIEGGVESLSDNEVLQIVTSPNYFSDLLDGFQGGLPKTGAARPVTVQEIEQGKPLEPSWAEYAAHEIRMLLNLPGVKFLASYFVLARELERRLTDKAGSDRFGELRLKLLVADAIRDASEDLVSDRLARIGKIVSAGPRLVPPTGMTTPVLVEDTWMSFLGEDRIHPFADLGPRWFLEDPERGAKFLEFGQFIVEENGREGKEMGHLFDLTYFAGVPVEEASALLGRPVSKSRRDVEYFESEIRLLVGSTQNAATA